jgi:hypothetical protein
MEVNNEEQTIPNYRPPFVTQNMKLYDQHRK